MKKTRFRDIDVYYTDQGEGTAIILVHGYLESAEIWKDFIPLLTGRFRVICPDLPGHGRSGTWGNEHSMEDLAGSVRAVAAVANIDRFVLVGHSLGGYVTMAFTGLYPERLLGYSLFHSTCFADTAEKKENRDREISLVLCGKKRQIVNVNIPKAFSYDNVQKLRKAVAAARAIALQSPDEGIVAMLNGMKARADRSGILQNPDLPLLLIGGMKDNYIPVEVFERLVQMAPHARCLRLADSGHMGFMEEPEASARALAEFAGGLT
jgi:pimeloyl-ACP methyl ester carboxylesterase